MPEQGQIPLPVKALRCGALLGVLLQSMEQENKCTTKKIQKARWK